MACHLPEERELEKLENHLYDKQIRNYKKGIKAYDRKNYMLAHFYFTKADDIKDAKEFLTKIENILHAYGFFLDGRPKKAMRFAKKHKVDKEASKFFFQEVIR